MDKITLLFMYELLGIHVRMSVHWFNYDINFMNINDPGMITHNWKHIPLCEGIPKGFYSVSY